MRCGFVIVCCIIREFANKSVMWQWNMDQGLDLSDDDEIRMKRWLYRCREMCDLI